MPETMSAPELVRQVESTLRGRIKCSKLELWRKAWGYTQKQLADLSGISRQTINRLEHGITTPSAHTASRLARALQATTSELFPDGVPVKPVPAPDLTYAWLAESVATDPRDDWGYNEDWLDGDWERRLLDGVVAGEPVGGLSERDLRLIRRAERRMERAGYA